MASVTERTRNEQFLASEALGGRSRDNINVIPLDPVMPILDADGVPFLHYRTGTVVIEKGNTGFLPDNVYQILSAAGLAREGAIKLGIVARHLPVLDQMGNGAKAGAIVRDAVVVEERLELADGVALAAVARKLDLQGIAVRSTEIVE